MPDKNTFEARLARIQEKHGTAPMTAGAPAGGAPAPSDDRSRGGAMLLTMLVLGLLVLAGGTWFAIQMMISGGA